MPIDSDSPHHCAQRINATIAEVFSSLQSLAGEVGQVWKAREADGRQPSSQDMKQLQPAIDRLALRTESCVGAGFILQPGLLADSQLYMEWRRRIGERKLQSLSPNVNPRSANCFHYEDKPWFSVPRESGQPAAIGPYVDVYCTGMYILTFSQPILLDGRFIGIAGADLPMHHIERLFTRSLMHLPQEALLLSPEGRVVASNTADWAVGDLAYSLLKDSACKVVPLDDSANAWSLLCLPVSRRLAA
ncbi:cache domain-containing protein [Stutzerimonas kirkiae]|uniref:cache domain-containing protein n=1 Tax=Stutzerimonas kirkiae TaxID=2211392 RepID=UPI0013F15880|nr:cache domain-containing protein [Stutzerimonas kirkiae]